MTDHITVRAHAEILAAASLNLIAASECHRAGAHEEAERHTLAARNVLVQAMKSVLLDAKKTDGAEAIRVIDRPRTATRRRQTR